MAATQDVGTRLISGTWLGIDHFSDGEAVRFQDDIRALTEDQWRSMIDDMHAIGIDTLIFQQCATWREGGDKPTAYYPSPTRPRMRWMKGDTFGAVVDRATELGMKIYYGCGAMDGPGIYSEMEAAWEDMAVTVNELGELYGDLPSFAGWYWTSEYPPCSTPGRDVLVTLVPRLRKLWDAEIMIAPGADRVMAATVLNDIDVDVVAYQDGVGINITPKSWNRFPQTNRYHSLDRLPYLYEVIRKAHDAWQDPDNPRTYWNYYTRPRGRTAFWNDLEVWEFDHRGALIPAEMSRVQAQLELTAPFVDKQVIFQYPGLLCSPEAEVKVGGERAVELYEQYAAYRQRLLDEGPGFLEQGWKLK
jgi:hypothetical protein